MWEPSAERGSAESGVWIRPLNEVRDTGPILGFLPDLFETNFPGFVCDTEFAAFKRRQLHEAALDPGQVVLVAEDSLGVCGFIWLGIETEYRRQARGEVRAIYVHPRVRNQGVGRRLMEHGEAFLVAFGCQSVRLMVTASNAAACRLYDELGYAVTRHQMEKRLSEGP